MQAERLAYICIYVDVLAVSVRGQTHLLVYEQPRQDKSVNMENTIYLFIYLF